MGDPERGTGANPNGKGVWWLAPKGGGNKNINATMGDLGRQLGVFHRKIQVVNKKKCLVQCDTSRRQEPRRGENGQTLEGKGGEEKQKACGASKKSGSGEGINKRFAACKKNKMGEPRIAREVLGGGGRGSD